MKVVILAGGRGTRLSEETEMKPKPMVEIGGHPILWHIMKHYAYYGYNEFVIALGYKGAEIKRFFLEYSALNSNFSINLATGKTKIHNQECEDWIVHLVDTGLHTDTGGRIKRVASIIGQETFMVTYGDGLANINIKDLETFHRSRGTIATISAVRPPARFGSIKFNGKLVAQFIEKPQAGEGWINGGFMVFEPKVLDFIEGDKTSLEHEILEMLADKEELSAYHHDGFWQCMDTLRDKQLLESLWQEGRAHWMVTHTNFPN